VSIDKLKREFVIRTRWRGFPLHPDIPEEGVSLADFMNRSSGEIKKIVASMEMKASELGLPLGKLEKLYNTRLAQELGAWSESKNKGDEFHNTVFRAYFANGKNPSNIATLVDLADSVGLPGHEARDILKNRSFKSEVDRDWTTSHELGIKAVPTFILNNNRLVGAQPYDKFKKLMEDYRIQKR
jgi:predicted DsbA family dithiol-disulfide isomerase